jgi:hypothetical protein
MSDVDLTWLGRIREGEKGGQYYVNLISFMLLDADKAFDEPLMPWYSHNLRRLDAMRKIEIQHLSQEETEELSEIQTQLDLMDEFLEKLRDT